MIDNFKEYKEKTKIITESSLARIWQHIQNDNSFGVISPFRGEVSIEENFGRLIELKDYIRSNLKFGFIELEGGFKEKAKNGKYRWVEERSLFIPKIRKSDLIELGEKYDQDSVVYKDNDEFVLLSTNKNDGIGKTLTNFVKQNDKDKLDFDSEKTKEFFSKLLKGGHRDRKWVFNDVDESYLYEIIPFGFNEVAYLRDDKVRKKVKLI